MIELLSLPRRPTENITVPNVKFESGLPINSLPGWEHIPLNLKLPMLKCPGNQVTFSKNKIGQSLRHLKLEFDSSGQDSIPEYNPLHDSNLKTFYANERNLKRLRENGEITLDNDVICNLKDFNEYRHQLHKSQLHYILQEMSRLESEQHDRRLISNAESITNRDHQRLYARDHSYSRIIYRKYSLDQSRQERFQRLYERTLERFSYIHMVRTIDQTATEHKKVLQQLKYRKHADVRNDLQRKRLISLKKLYQFKKDRFHKNLRIFNETRRKVAEEKQIQSWNKRLAERIANEIKVEGLLKKANEKKKVFIENHVRKYNDKWFRIQQNIKKIALKNHNRLNLNSKEHRIKSPKNARKENHFIEKFQSSFETLLDSEVIDALNAVLDFENEAKMPYEPGDAIYKAAQYIKQVILKKFNKDLSQDRNTYQSVYRRIDKFFEEAKKFVIFRATQIIASLHERSKQTRHQNYSRSSVVSFSHIPSTIGMSSYQINPFVEVKEVSNRKPTPSGSLTSIIVISATDLLSKMQYCNLSRNELVFIEHYVVKFKRELIVGIGRKVFAAIQCHYENKVLDVRQELLDIDRKFLLNQVTKAILNYAINSLNFVAILKLCVSSLASDIIWSLQKQLLKPNPDRRRIVKPSIQCTCRNNSMQLCFSCAERNF